MGLNCGVIGEWDQGKPGMGLQTCSYSQNNTVDTDVIVASPKIEDDEDEDVPSTPPTSHADSAGSSGDLSILKSK